MFDLVADVQHYDEFLPWITAVRVRKDTPEEMLADLIVGFKGLRETFTSRVVKARAETITVDYVDGPLKYLRNEWRFTDVGVGGCTVSFTVDFAFKSSLFERVAGTIFSSAVKAMTGAFVTRAEAIYGAPSGKSNSSATSAA